MEAYGVEQSRPCASHVPALRTRREDARGQRRHRRFLGATLRRSSFGENDFFLEGESAGASGRFLAGWQATRFGGGRNRRGSGTVGRHWKASPSVGSARETCAFSCLRS